MKQGAEKTMENIGSLFGRLTSRKLWLTVFGLILVTMYPDAQTAIVTLIATFVGAEGAADAVSRYNPTERVSTVSSAPTLLGTLGGDDDFDTSAKPVTGREATLPSPLSTGGEAPL